MDRTKLICNLAKNNKIAHSHSDEMGIPLLDVSSRKTNNIRDEYELCEAEDEISWNEPASVSSAASPNAENNTNFVFEKLNQQSSSKLINVTTAFVPDNQSKKTKSKDSSELLEDDLVASFENKYESSGSEYIPPSESGDSSSIAESNVIPYQTNVIESGYSKVKRYLKDLATFSDNEKDTNFQLPVSEITDDNTTLNGVPCNEIKNNNSKVLNIETGLDNVTASTLCYKKKKSAPERPTICPICYKDVITHFSRHLFRYHKNHKDVILLQSYKPRSKERLSLISSLRKQGYFHLKVEKGILNPVRTSKDPTTAYFVCTYCLGHYSKKLLYKHVKICKSKPEGIKKPGNKCLSHSQTFMASITSKNHDYLKTSRIKSEVFGIMRPDDISATAKNDPLISLYGELLLNKHKRQQIATVVSNKLREMARLLIALKSVVSVEGLFDALKPEMFRFLVIATKQISGFDPETKSFKAPSLALHMGTSLKIVCDVALKLVIEKRAIPNITWKDREEKKKEIKELRKLIEAHWCSELASLALKGLKEQQWHKPVQLPLADDIQKFQIYLNNLADNAYDKLNNSASETDLKTNYKILTECVLTLTVMFNRKRVGDVQYLKIETYKASGTQTTNQEAFMDSLTKVEKIISKKFKRVVTGGKGSKPVPILFSNRIQKFIDCLLEIRKSDKVVPLSNPYLFANPGSESRWMSGTNIIRKLALKSSANNPLLLTSSRFRKHIATTLQLMTMGEEEMEQIATFMGHTKKTHAEFYRLPQDIYQTAKVAKVLLLMEKGKGNEFKGKSLNEIEVERDVYYSSDSEMEKEDDAEELVLPPQRALRRAETSSATNDNDIIENLETDGPYTNLTNENTEEMPQKKKKSNTKKKKTDECLKESEQCSEKKVSNTSGRLRWSAPEKQIVLKHFAKHIKNKRTPKKHECEELIAANENVLGNKDWVRVKTFVYNSFRLK